MVMEFSIHDEAMGSTMDDVMLTTGPEKNSESYDNDFVSFQPNAPFTGASTAAPISMAHTSLSHPFINVNDMDTLSTSVIETSFPNLIDLSTVSQSLPSHTLQALPSSFSSNLGHNSQVMLASYSTQRPASHRHSPEEWESHREKIGMLYEKMTLPNVMMTMSSRHNFHASTKQYKDRLTKWGLDKKNVKARHMDAILSKVYQRQQAKKRTEVRLANQIIPQRKISRAMRRKRCLREISFSQSHGSLSDDLDIIICRTPPADSINSPYAASPNPWAGKTFSLRDVQYSNDFSPFHAILRSNRLPYRLIRDNDQPIDTSSLPQLVDYDQLNMALQFVMLEKAPEGRRLMEEEAYLMDEVRRLTPHGILGPTQEISNVLVLLGRVLADQGRWQSAEIIFTIATLLQEMLTGKSSQQMLKCLQHLSYELLEQNRHNEATDIYKWIWASQLASVPAEVSNWDSLSVMYRLAYAMYIKGAYASSEFLLIELLDHSKLVGGSHTAILHARNLFSGILRVTSRVQDAKTFHGSTVLLIKEQFGEANHEYVYSALELAMIHADLRSWDENEEVLQTMSPFVEQVFGYCSPKMGQIWSMLSETMFEQSRIREAMDYAKQSVNLFKNLKSSDYTYAINASILLSKCHLALGELDTAAEIARLNLKACRKIRSEEDFQTIRTKSILGNIHFTRGEFEEAADLDLDVLEARREAHGEDHSLTAAAKWRLAGDYCKLGRYEESTHLRLENLRRARRLYGEHHRDTLYAKMALAYTYFTCGKYVQAVQIDKEALATAEVLYREEDSVDVANQVTECRNNLRQSEMALAGEEDEEAEEDGECEEFEESEGYEESEDSEEGEGNEEDEEEEEEQDITMLDDDSRFVELDDDYDDPVAFQDGSF